MESLSINLVEGDKNPVGLVWFERFDAVQDSGDQSILVEVQEGIISGAGTLVGFNTADDNAVVFSTIIPVSLDGSTNISDEEVSRVSAVIEGLLYNV